MSDTKQSLDEVFFEAAVQKPSGPERAAFLDSVCRDNPALRARLDLLLEGHAKGAEFLANMATRDFKGVGGPGPTAGMTQGWSDSESERAGAVIGRYKLLQKIGEGGCGTVYMAEQSEPVKRRVALKVIKLGMDTKSVIARFEAERQALALMDHPNIAKVLDGGATEAGRPYFVMELVRGTKITEYCDQANLSTRERLDLFIKVCQAVQHAHQKGIIHRDIKPSNILVTLHDGVPVPKVIDFGIAKATTDQRLTDKTLFTALEQFIGTPAYMSPEQAEMSGLDIDTRSDIYSLGVLLYEILTGKTPFDAKELLALGLDEMRRAIREQEPVRPSTRLVTMLEGELTTTAKHRHSDAPKLVQLLRGDVDWIVMKCLEKDRARRYETANGLASDIQRHLNNEAVLACPPSATYRFQKMVRRNKLAFAAVTSVTAALVLGVIVSTWQAIRATRAEREQNLQREVAVKASASEAEQRRLADIQRVAAEMQRNIAMEQRKFANMQLALQAWDDGDLRRTKELIEATRPAPDQMPAFEWRYLTNLCRDQSTATFGDTNHQYRSALFIDRDLLLLNDEKSLILRNIARRNDQVLFEDQDGISSPAFCSGNTNLLATVTDGGRIKVWDLAAKSLRFESEEPPRSRIGSINFSRDGKWLASVSSDNSIELWDVESRKPKPVRMLHRYARMSSGGFFSSDGRHLFSSGSETMIRSWNLATGAEEGAPLDDHTTWVFGLAMSPDGLRLASASNDSTVIVWDVNSRQPETKLLGHIAGVQVVAFSPDGRILASGGRDRTIRLWNVKTGQQTSLLRGHGTDLNRLSFSPDGQWLVSQSNDGLVKLWPATPRPEISILTGSRINLRDVTLSRDGRYVAAIETADSDVHAGVHLWDRFSGKHTRLDGHSDMVGGTAFSPDGRMFATSSHDQTVILWDLNDGKAVATLTNGFPAGSLAFSPDGQTLIVGGSKLNSQLGGPGGLQFWNVPSRQAVGTIPGEVSDIVQMALSANGALLATGHKDGAVRLWDARTRRLLLEYKGLSAGSVYCLAFSPTESLLAAGDLGGNIVLYSTATMVVVRPPTKAHTARVQSLAFSADGRTLVSGGQGGGIKLWNVAMFQVALTLKANGESVAFAQDGNFMATSGVDGTVRLWPATTLAAANDDTKTK